jgi:hypothetical protein
MSLKCFYKVELAASTAVAHNLLISTSAMNTQATSETTSAPPPRPRVWQDVAAESLLCTAVVAIALTGNNSVVLQINLWLTDLIPAYDPMVTMLVLAIVGIAALTLGAIRLKVSARRASEATPVLRPVRPRRTLPYLGS